MIMIIHSTHYTVFQKQPIMREITHIVLFCHFQVETFRSELDIWHQTNTRSPNLDGERRRAAVRSGDLDPKRPPIQKNGARKIGGRYL